MENTNFDYFYGTENENFLFLQMPKVFFKDSYFKNLSDSAKIAYSLLLERTGLSAKNNWRDSEGRVYIIYTIEEIMADLNCYQGKANKCLKELKEIGLIRTVRQGLNRPNLIYVMNFATEYKYPKNEPKTAEESRNCETSKSGNCDNRKSGFVNIANTEMPESQTNQTDTNKTDFNDTYRAVGGPGFKPPVGIYRSGGNWEKKESGEEAAPPPIDLIDKPTENLFNNPLINVEKIIAENICLDELLTKYPDKEAKIHEIYSIMCSTLNATDTFIRINKLPTPTATVRENFLKIDKPCFVYVLESIEKNAKNIKTNVANYTITSLFHAPRTVKYHKNYDESAFDRRPTAEEQTDSEKFFEKLVRRSMKF